MDNDRPRGPRAVGRVVDLLLLLAQEREGLTLAQISAALSVAKPTLLDTLHSLCDQHYLTTNDGSYRLGGNAYRMAGKIIASWSPSEAIRAEVKRLAAESGESVGFAIADWQIGQVIYIEAINSMQAVRYAMQAGLRAPLYASAAGRVLLAYSDDGLVDHYIERVQFKRLTDTTRASASLVRENIEQIRLQGYCASYGEMLPDTAAISAPVFSTEGQIIGALMLAAPLDRMKVGSDRFVAAILAAARRASCGYFPISRT